VRELGFILLLVGFAALCWFSLFTHSAERSVIVDRYKRLPQATDTFSRDEVVREIRDTAAEALLYCRGFLIPGAMMLAGGFLVSTGPRRSNQTRDDKNI